MKGHFITAIAFFAAGAASATFLVRVNGQTAPPSAPAASVATATTLPPNELTGQGNGEPSQTRLKNSPRHGEWLEVKIAGQEKPLKAWIVYPERPDKAPVVLTVMEIFGMTDWVRATADQLAADGFIAIAPDFLSLKPDGTRINAVPAAEIVADLNACRDYALKQIPSANGKTAIVGFCYGGTQVFNYAVAQPDLDAAVAFYGTPPQAGMAPDEAQLTKIKAPVAGFFGGNDNRVTSMVAPTVDIMKKLNKTYEPHIFDGAGHGFMRQQTPGANAKAAEQAWPAAIKFITDHTKADAK